jgi:tRNA(fMet)-specific endonuclease VapC
MEYRKVIVDTSILIDYFRKQKKEKSILYNLNLNYEIAISIITEFEFLVGFENTKELSFIDNMFGFFEIIPFDSKCVKTAVNIYRQLKKDSKLIPAPDLFIASTSISHNLDIATLNKNHFERVTGIKMINV